MGLLSHNQDRKNVDTGRLEAGKDILGSLLNESFIELELPEATG